MLKIGQKVKLKKSIIDNIKSVDSSTFISSDVFKNFSKFREGFKGYGIINNVQDGYINGYNVYLISSTGSFELFLKDDNFIPIPVNMPEV